MGRDGDFYFCGDYGGSKVAILSLGEDYGGPEVAILSFVRGLR